jgi:hypothetical protein
LLQLDGGAAAAIAAQLGKASYDSIAIRAGAPASRRKIWRCSRQ